MSRLTWLCISLLLIGLGLVGACQVLPAIDQTPKVKLWQARAALTADKPTEARIAILDGIYAGHSADLALAYENLYRQKPSQTRLGVYLHAAVLANTRGTQREEILHHESTAAIAKRAMEAAKPYLPPSDLATSRGDQNKKKITEANIWLAWGEYLSGNRQDISNAREAFQKALALDQNLAEAWFGLADLIQSYQDIPSVKARAAETVKNLDKAEALEPKIHVLTLPARAYVTGYRGDPKQAMNYMREYLRLWPDAPNAATIQRGLQEH